RPPKLFLLKNVWYITLGDDWSMSVKPPSPSRACVQESAPSYRLVPLSCVPPSRRFGSVGCSAIESNCVTSSVWFRLVHATPASFALSVRNTPPSSATNTMFGFDRATAIQCVSACRPPVTPFPRLMSVHVAPALSVRQTVPPLLAGLADVP